MSRLLDAAGTGHLKNVLGYHLGEQFHPRIDVTRAKLITEAERQAMLPLLLGLIPRTAALRTDRYASVKPLIAGHVRALGGDPHDDLLIDLIKEMSDNFDRTRPREDPRTRTRKSSIGDLRQMPSVYQRIRQGQGTRCAVCGTTFGSGPEEETLDHVIPWRLGGDPAGGWNWQLLCRRCNEAKSTLFGAVATAEYWNWSFDDLCKVRDPLAPDSVSPRLRYIVLSTRRQCQHPSCEVNPTRGHLLVKKRFATGLAIFDHLSVFCEKHAAASEGIVLG